MFIKDVFKPGQLIMPMPVGIPTTLQYNAKGILERVYNSVTDISPDTEVSYDMFNALYEHKVAPVKILLTGGTTRIKGVLYTGKLYPGNGKLPESIMMDMTCDFTEDPDKFNFFAGSISSTAAVFNGANSAKKWFSMCNFKQLPSFLAPTPVTKSAFEQALYANYPFIKDMIMYFIIYSRNDVSYVDTGIQEYVIRKVSRYTDDYGNIKGMCTHADGQIALDYSDIVRLNIQRKRCLVVDKSWTPIRCFGDSKGLVSGTISCEVCGKQIVSPMHGPVKCGDDHCLSNMYPNFKHFIESYNMPELSFSAYMEYVNLDMLHTVSDLFTINPWKTYTLETSLAQLLRSLIPINVVPVGDVITSFVQHCNGNVNMFNYYVENPDKILPDFHLSGRFISSMIQWLSNEFNKKSLLSLLTCENIIITEDGTKFQGSPIFRNKKIMITGEFTHGSHADIIAILKGYSAEVVTKFDPDVDCAIIGSSLQDINSVELNKVRALNLPVFDENSFFRTYEIDKDLAENLL